MSVNSTSDVQTPLSFFFLSREITCANVPVGRYVLSVLAFVYTLIILPLSVYILSVGLQRWRRQRSVSSAVTHSDFFTYNMAVMELVEVCGHVLYYSSTYLNHQLMWLLGVMFVSFTWAGQTLFPVATCVERYLAVVHPITYRDLRQSSGIRVRNVAAGCIWLVGVFWVGFLMLLYVYNYYNLIPSALMLTLSSIVIMFCSISVVRVLIRPPPGKAGRVPIEPSKLRAIRTIRVMMGVLWVKFGGSVVALLIRLSTLVTLRCLGEGSIIVFNLVGSLVLPVLFLQRMRKLPICGQGPGPV